MNNRCYVTGSTRAVRQYEFGKTVVVPLSEQAFAHFVILATKDEAHQEIHNRLLNLCLDADDIVTESKIAFPNGVPDDKYDDFIAMQLSASKKDADILQASIEKANSGLRILRELRKKFLATGSLD